MMTALIILSILGTFILFAKVRRLEKDRGPSKSFTLKIDVKDALLKSEHFVKYFNQKLRKNGDKIASLDNQLHYSWVNNNIATPDLGLTINYLASENTYFITTNSGKSTVSPRNKTPTSTTIYSNILYTNTEKGSIILELSEREMSIPNSSKLTMDSVSVSFFFNESDCKNASSSKEIDFQLLCDIPMFTFHDTLLTTLGFTSNIDVKNRDIWGNSKMALSESIYSKNGVFITMN